MTRLSALGFADPATALGHLQALTRGVSRTAAVQRVLLPVMLESFADAADPDAGLLAYRRVSATRSAAPPGTCGCCATREGSGRPSPAAPQSGWPGCSPPVPTSPICSPGPPRPCGCWRAATRLRPRSRAELEVGLLAGVRRRDGLGRDWQATVGVARAARRLELFRVACADLLGLLDVTAGRHGAVGRGRSDAAGGLRGGDAQRRGASAGVAPGGLPMRLAVIAMGRLGGRELGYSSDADVLFVHEPYAPRGEPSARRFGRRSRPPMTSPRRCAGCLPCPAPIRRSSSTPGCGPRASRGR